MVISSVNSEQWRQYWQECSCSSIYLDHRWITLINLIYPKLTTHRLACHDGSGDLSWLLPLVEITPITRRKSMMISLPFGNYGGFLLPRDCKAPLSEGQLRPLCEYFAKSSSFALEIRELTEPHSLFQVDRQYQRFELNLPLDEETLWAATLTGNARTCVRKAEKFGSETVFDHPQALQIFTNIYLHNASVHGTPVHHRLWFLKMAELFPDELEIVLSRFRGTFVGALLLLHYQKKTILHAAVSLPISREIAATDHMLWQTLKKLTAQRKTEIFDFGRTRPEPGKYFFKRKWGGRQKDICYGYLLKKGERPPQLVPHNPRLKLVIKIWKLMPAAVQHRVGPYLRVRIPT